MGADVDPASHFGLGVKAALDALNGRRVEKRIDTGVTLVTMDNFNDPKVQRLLYPLGR